MSVAGTTGAPLLQRVVQQVADRSLGFWLLWLATATTSVVMSLVFTPPYLQGALPVGLAVSLITLAMSVALGKPTTPRRQRLCYTSAIVMFVLSVVSFVWYFQARLHRTIQSPTGEVYPTGLDLSEASVTEEAAGIVRDNPGITKYAMFEEWTTFEPNAPLRIWKDDVLQSVQFRLVYLYLCGTLVFNLGVMFLQVGLEKPGPDPVESLDSVIGVASELISKIKI